MIVRPARFADAPAICAFWNPMIADTAVTFSTVLRSPEPVAADIAARGACFQVAEAEGQVLGFATCFPFRAGPGYAFTREHTIILAPQAQGRGAGRALMAALEVAAMAEGAHSMIAAVTGENPAGLRFHAALGFAEVGRLPQAGFKFGRWMDLVLMQKIIGLPH